MLNKVKVLLGLTDSSQDDVLGQIIEDMTNLVLLYINEEELPTKLESVVRDMSIMRFNRLGSEGLKSMGIDVISNSYIEDYLAPHKGTLDTYKKAQGKGLSKVRFF